MFLPGGVSTLYKAVPSSSKEFVTVEGLRGAFINLPRPGLLGYPSQISSRSPDAAS